MYDIGLKWLDFMIILSGFAAFGTLAGLTIWLVDRVVAAKRRKTVLCNGTPETSSAPFAHNDEPARGTGDEHKLNARNPALGIRPPLAVGNLTASQFVLHRDGVDLPQWHVSAEDGKLVLGPFSSLEEAMEAVKRMR